jgi:hypothetical protein
METPKMNAAPICVGCMACGECIICGPTPSGTECAAVAVGLSAFYN